nr:transposase zinc-binding domain-containing protein [Cohnella sp. YIM B05605]
MESNILKRIFFDEHGHWDKFVRKYEGRIRAYVLKEVAKFRDCGNPKNGFKLLVCEGCHDLRLVLYRCKGRFCTTCSCGEAEERSRHLEEDVFQVNHHDDREIRKLSILPAVEPFLNWPLNPMFRVELRNFLS